MTIRDDKVGQTVGQVGIFSPLWPASPFIFN